MKTFIPIISKLSKASRTRHHLHPYRGCGGPCCQLRFNAANCKVPHLRQNNRKHVYNMKTHGTRARVSIGPSIMEMDLGVLVDTDLQFSKHVEEQVNKANRTLGLIRRSFQFLNRESMKLIFSALSETTLRVRICCLGATLSKRQTFNRRCPEMGNKNSPHSQRSWIQWKTQVHEFAKYEVPSGKGWHDWDIYKYTRTVQCQQQSLEKGCRVNNKRAQTYKLKKSSRYTSLHQHFFSFRVVDSWNSLPPDVLRDPSSQAFKNWLDSIWSERKFLSWWIFFFFVAHPCSDFRVLKVKTA